MPGETSGLDRPVAGARPSTLREVSLFAGLPPAIEEAVARAAVPRRFAAGNVIFLEGEPGTTLYVLRSGWVRATRTSPEGREQAMQYMRPGDVFGEIAVFTGGPYPGTVVALEDVEAWAIDGAVLLDLAGRHAELSRAIIRHLANRVVYFIGLVEDLSLRSVEARLAKTLLRHAEQRGHQLIVPRRDWTTFDAMAARLGTVRDVLGRALRTLENEGLLKVDRHEITLLDPEGLSRRGAGKM